MTLRLRQQHRIAVAALAVILPAALGSGLALRQPIVLSQLQGLSLPPNTYGPISWTNYTLWPDKQIATYLRRGEARTVAVELAWSTFHEPDLLLYWVPGKKPQLASLPSEARFIGSVQPNKVLPLPLEIRGPTGMLVLYSLANHEVVAASSGFVIPET
jgi:hypothetical protein